jgi:hypothetical protein
MPCKSFAGLARWIRLAAIAATSAAAQDYSAWAHSKDLYYDTSPDGANVTADVSAFPVLVRLTAADFPFAEARGDGRDLRFAKPDGAPLHYEIDVYDSAAGAAAFWVLADTLRGNSKAQLLRIYWGNPSAGASADSGGVFTRANGFRAGWHLGGQFPVERRNAVPGGMPAVPGNYDADEQTPGLIGYADSLDGGNPGDHLQTWEPFDSLSGGFTFSVWAYPTAAANWGRFMDFGNGQAQDNLFLTRVAASDSLRFSSLTGATVHSVTAGGAIVQGQWQYFTVTVAGTTARLYRNGVEIAGGDLGAAITDVRRGSNYLGRSNWGADAYFRGKLDEPEVASVARGADWIKLAYANQKAGQTLLTYTAPVVCAARFEAPADTSVPEESLLSLAGAADCADRYQWAQESGPPLRILDPETKVLDVSLPRIAADTSVVLEFSAHFPDSVRSGKVRVSIRNSIPEPAFTLPAALAWNGRDSLLLRPEISNAAALAASSHPDLNAAWKVEGDGVDTAWRSDGLLLQSASEGNFSVTLCLDNDGPPVCAKTAVAVDATVGLDFPRPVSLRQRAVPEFGADGRLRPGPAGAVRRFRKPGEPAGFPR